MTRGFPDCPRRTRFQPVRLSLVDLLGGGYVDAVCAARAALAGGPELRGPAHEAVDFYPDAMHRRLLDLLPRVGQRISPPAGECTAGGATSGKFAAATNTAAAPVSGYGYYRVGEDGRLYLLTKSEHYHASLGHSFPGYRLIDVARQLGIPQATHNNTRGHITRLLEERLVQAANGLADDDAAGLAAVLASREPGVLNRVINLETGSLAAEAALKLVLNRFHPIQADLPTPPKYHGRVPVMLVLGDAQSTQANYHGTTILAQAMRGMWADLLAGMERQGLVAVRSVPYNDIARLEDAFRTYEEPPYKLAGFFHEIVLMNYGARLLTEPFLRRAYELCAAHDVPPVVDEIQSGIWSPETFMFREYGLRPSAVALGKGLPGGEYPASRLLFSGDLDTLPQFGALVTNGQEELASLAYLITMEWSRANADVTRAVGDYFEQRMHELADAHRPIRAFEGRRHLGGLHFDDVAEAKTFARSLNAAGLDISVQTYKTTVPPAALVKLPLTAGFEVVDAVVDRMRAALQDLSREPRPIGAPG